MIDETMFPVLNWMRYRPGNRQQPPNIHRAVKPAGKAFLDHSPTLATFLDLLPSDYYFGSTLPERLSLRQPLAPGSQPQSVSRLVSLPVFEDIDTNAALRQRLFPRFYDHLPDGAGCLLVAGGLQYLYRVCSTQETNWLARTRLIAKPGESAGRWMVCGLFLGTDFYGFESGFSYPECIELAQDSYTPEDMEPGQLLSLLGVGLLHANSGDFTLTRLRANSAANTTPIDVIQLDKPASPARRRPAEPAPVPSRQAVNPTPMDLFAVGQPMPAAFTSPTQGRTFAVARFNEGLFDLLYYVDQNQQPGLPANWKRAPLRYGVFSGRDEEGKPLPFFLVEMPAHSFACRIPLSIHTFSTGESAQTWLNTAADWVRLFLIDTYTNVLLAARYVPLRTDCLDQIKDSLEEQDAAFRAQSEVEAAFGTLFESTTTQDMIGKTTMFPFG